MLAFRRKWAAIAVALSLPLAALSALDANAAFIPIPAAPTPRVAVNDVVRAVVIGSDAAYIAGDFTTATGPNGTFPRSRVAAFDLATGDVLPFRADASARVRALALSGDRLFIGGDFTSIAGQSRSRLAEVNAQTGAVATGFRVNTTSAVRALAIGGNQLVVGGQFGQISGVAQARLALVNLTTNSVNTAFRPVLNNTIHAVAATPNEVYAGGDFTQVNGGTVRFLAAFNPDGTTRPIPWAVSDQYNVTALDLDEDGRRLFAAIGGQGNQAASFSTASGVRQWRQRAEGDVQAVTYHGGNVYFGFHEGFEGDFNVRTLAADAATGQLESAFRPPVNSFWGVRALDATDRGLLAGGEFTNVNGVEVGRAAFFDAELGPVPPRITQLVGGSDSWRYRDQATAPTDWADSAFNDSTWPQGSAQLGYGDGDETTVIGFGGNAASKHLTSWYRRDFEWASQHPANWLTLSVIADDGAVVYLNGTEVARDNMPAGTITATSRAVAGRSGTAENAVRTFSIDPALLRDGRNVLAVEIHQDYRGTSDSSMQATLTTGD